MDDAAMVVRVCPPWCRRHGPARCRSDPTVVGWRSGPLCHEVAVQLEQWQGKVPVVSLLLPDTVLLLPEDPAVELWTALGGLVDQAGWSATGDRLQRHQQPRLRI